MIKEVVTYKDYDGVEQTDVLYFSLNKMEATMINAKAGGNVEEYLKKLQKENKQYEMMCFLRDMMLDAYGERDADSRRFNKGAAIKDKFANSLAFAELFEAIVTDEKRAAKFGREVFATAMANAKGDQRAKLAEVIK